MKRKIISLFMLFLSLIVMMASSCDLPENYSASYTIAPKNTELKIGTFTKPQIESAARECFYQHEAKLLYRLEERISYSAKGVVKNIKVASFVYSRECEHDGDYYANYAYIHFLSDDQIKKYYIVNIKGTYSLYDEYGRFQKAETFDRTIEVFPNAYLDKENTSYCNNHGFYDYKTLSDYRFVCVF